MQRYRVTTSPVVNTRGPWRASRAEAFKDAISLGLAIEGGKDLEPRLHILASLEVRDFRSRLLPEEYPRTTVEALL